VNPVRVDIVDPRQPTELRITNTGKDELSVQIDARQWTQNQQGEDQLSITDLLLAVPPLFTLPAGERQIVRIGYIGAPNENDETSFRLLVTELAPESTRETRSALNMRLQLSIPVFVAPIAASPEAELVVESAQPLPDGTLLTVRNVGNSHTRLSGVDLLGDTGGWSPISESVGLVRYLLPESRMELKLPASAGRARAVRVTSADGRSWEHAVQPAP
jgi:fimbrial chaperone protein